MFKAANQTNNLKTAADLPTAPAPESADGFEHWKLHRAKLTELQRKAQSVEAERAALSDGGRNQVALDAAARAIIAGGSAPSIPDLRSESARMEQEAAIVRRAIELQTAEMDKAQRTWSANAVNAAMPVYKEMTRVYAALLIEAAKVADAMRLTSDALEAATGKTLPDCGRNLLGRLNDASREGRLAHLIDNDLIGNGFADKREPWLMPALAR